MNKKSPKIRFKGFTDDWEQRMLGEITESYSGGTPSVANHSYYGGSIPFIRSAEINSINTELYLTEEGLNSSSAKLVEEGDILYALYGATSGEVGISQINGAINQAILAIKPKSKYDPNFIMQWLRRQKNSIISTYLQGGQGNLSGAIVKDLILSVPIEYDEQIRIGAFFKQLDNTITLHQEAIQHQQDLKKALLQKLFPVNGVRIPTVRFATFKKEWEQRKLEQLAQFNPKSSLPDKFEYVDLESVVGTEMISHRTETKENAPSRAQRLATQGDVFYQTVRPYQKNNYLFDLPHNNYVFSTGYAQLRPFGDSYFLLSRLQDDIFIFNVLQRSTGTSYPAINSSDLSQIEVGVPLVVEEQIKIGVFFKNLDHIIALHQDAIHKLQLLKQSLLQKMFVN